MSSRIPGVICYTKAEEIDKGTLVRTLSFSPASLFTIPNMKILGATLKHSGSIYLTYGDASIVDKTESVDRSIMDFKARDSVNSLAVASTKIFVKKKVLGDNPATTDRVETHFDTGERKRELTRRKTRNLNTIDSLVLHQTAVLRKNPNDNIARYFQISVHFIIVPDGTIYRLYNDEVRCNGSSGFNSRSVSVEFEGKFKHDRKNGNIGKEKPTQAQLKSGRKLIVYLKKRLPNFKYVFAHSQSANKNCPGPEIWHNVGEWAIVNGLCSASGRMETAGSGSAIPESWIKGEVKKRNKVIRSFKIDVKGC